MAGVWTRNFYNLLTSATFGDTPTTSTATPTDYAPPIRVRLADGSYKTVTHEDGNDAGAALSRSVESLLNIGKVRLTLLTSEPTSYNTPGVYVGFGVGSGTAGYEDYKLNSIANVGNIVSVTGSLTESSNYDNVTHEYGSKRTFTLTNSSATTYNVTEFGLYVPGAYVNSTNANLCLVYHEMFNTPIALAQGESIILGFIRKGVVYNYTPY